MSVTRRALPLLALAATISPAMAETIGLSVACDTTLAPAVRRAGRAYRAKSSTQVFVFATGPGLLVPQLERNIQNDIVVTQVTILEQLAEAKIIASVPAGPRWSNPLVVAGPSASAPTDQVFAAPDPTPAFALDGPALIAKLGLKPSRVLGTVNTDVVARQVLSGAAQAGLMYMTDVRAHPGLVVIRPVPPDIQPPRVYAGSVTRLASPQKNPQGFITFLATPEANAVLAEAGLEPQA